MTKIVKQSIQEEYEQKRIIIYITFPNLVAKKLRVCIEYPISILFQIHPIGEKTFFYQGIIIRSDLTFQNYGITDNDRIAILPTDQMTLKTEQFWRKATKRDIENKYQMAGFQNPLLKNDIAYHQDLKITRIENNSRCFRKLIRNYQFLTNETNESDNSTYLECEKKENPSESSLPKLW